MALEAQIIQEVCERLSELERKQAETAVAVNAAKAWCAILDKNVGELWDRVNELTRMNTKGSES